MFGYKGKLPSILVVIEMFFILTVSVSVYWLWCYTIALQDAATGEH